MQLIKSPLTYDVKPPTQLKVRLVLIGQTSLFRVTRKPLFKFHSRERCLSDCAAGPAGGDGRGADQKPAAGGRRTEEAEEETERHWSPQVSAVLDASAQDELCLRCVFKTQKTSTNETSFVKTFHFLTNPYGKEPRNELRSFQKVIAQIFCL